MHRRSTRPAFGFVAPLMRFLKSFRREDGAVAVWFAVLALPLAVLAFALIDVNRAAVEKRHLQDALDAATLLAARSSESTTDGIQTVGYAALLSEFSGVTAGTLDSGTFVLDGNSIKATATATVKPFIADLWLRGNMKVSTSTEVIRSSTNLEVAMVLDITGSMDEVGKIDVLRTAAADLVDFVVQDVQTPYYTKMAVAPFSIGVNAGPYADAVRGAVTPGVAVTEAKWTVGSSIGISGITKAKPAVVTSASNHGLSTGNRVYIEGVKGMTDVNGKSYIITKVSNTTFQLNSTDTRSSNSYSSGSNDYLSRCLNANCDIEVTTSSAHGLATSDYVTFLSLPGWPDVSGSTFQLTKVSDTVFTLPMRGVAYPNAGSGGTSYCTKQGCEFLRYLSGGGNPRIARISTCVTERSGGEIATDASPMTRSVGRHYGTGCPGASIMPLTTDKTALKALVSTLPATGGTAGQIGIAWGWYLVSPTFDQKAGGAAIWPTASKPALYTAPETLKVVIFMTDGEFNTSYCGGVLSSSTNGCTTGNSNTGTPTEQAQALCTAMRRDNKVVIYTVGFDVGGPETVAGRFVTDCASSPAHVFLPANGGDLKEAFAAIGRDIMKLRLSK